jgi:predicted CxxxxCH...CXXCH cytochrome family protein
VNGLAEFAFNTTDVPWLIGASYTGSPTMLDPPDGTTAWNTTNNKCLNLYCHTMFPQGDASANGTGDPLGFNSVLVWNGPYNGCMQCHYTTRTGSHEKHYSVIPGNNCLACHYTWADNLKASHGNHNIDVIFDPTKYPSGTYSQSGEGNNPPGNGYGTCSNISCHGSGTPQWGGTVDCSSCHGNPPATGAHLAHTDGTGAAYGSDSNLSTPAAYLFNCGNCHPVDVAKHGNGTVDIELYNAAATGFKRKNLAAAGRTGTGNATVCANVYCHSSGQEANVRTYAATPQWGSTFTGNRCAGCHGDPPAYLNGGSGSTTANSHYASQLSWDRPVEGGHLVGLHFDNIRKDPPDSAEPLFPRGGSAGSGAGHGDPATSTTISCPTCHAGTVTVAGQLSAPGTIFSCQACHTSPVAGSIADKSRHVNGSRDVQFMTGTFRTRAQLQPDPPPWPEPLPGPFTSVIAPLGWTRNNGFKVANDSHDSVPFSGSYNPADKSCTTACHLNQPATWGDTSKGCFACHADL